MRYSRGFNSHFEFNFRKKEKTEVQELKATVAHKKKQIPSSIKPLAAGTDTVSIHTENSSNILPPAESENSKASIAKNNIKSKVTAATHAANNASQTATSERAPYEINSQWALILFLLGAALVLWGGALLIIISFRLARIGRRRILDANIALRGLFFDNVIIVLCTIASIIGFIFILYFLQMLSFYI